VKTGKQCYQKVTFPEKTFYFTGEFNQDVGHYHQIVDSLGGLALKKITDSLDYLVLGSEITTNLMNSPHPPVRKTSQWINEGWPIQIINEDTFIQASKQKQKFPARTKRSIRLLVDFEEHSLAPGWAFAIDGLFKRVLDIRLTERVKNKKSYWIWTQGTNFKFKRGYTLYNSPEGWPHPNVTTWVQITEATDAGTTSDPDGLVIFDLYYRHIDGTAIKDEKPRICTQIEFVQFLQSGILHGEKLV